MTKKDVAWSDKEVEALKYMWVEHGLTMYQISDALPGRTRNAVAGKIARMGMTGLGHRFPGQNAPFDRRASPLSPHPR